MLFRSSDGLVGSVNGTYLNGQENLVIHQGRYYNEYDSDTGKYIGLHQIIPVSKNDSEDTVWAAAVLIPQESYVAYTNGVQQTWIIVSIVLLFILSKALSLLTVIPTLHLYIFSLFSYIISLLPSFDLLIF